MNPSRIARIAAAAIALLSLGGCGAEPDEAAIRAGLELMHREWAEQARQGTAAAPSQGAIALPRVNLSAEAVLDLQITEVRKLDCRPAPEPKQGYVCAAEVVASSAGKKTVSRRLEGRFISGGSQWVVRDLRPLDVN